MARRGAVREPAIGNAWLLPRAIVERNDVRVRAQRGPRTGARACARREPRGGWNSSEGEVKLVGRPPFRPEDGSVPRSGGEPDRGWPATPRGRALDCFTYGGAFALAARAQGGARASRWTSAEQAAGARARGGCAQPRRERRVQGSPTLSICPGGERGRRALRPPIVSTRRVRQVGRTTIEAALRGYKRINLRAFHLMSPGGAASSLASCSFQVDDRRPSSIPCCRRSDAKRSVQVIERRGAAKDHPTLAGRARRRAT